MLVMPVVGVKNRGRIHLFQHMVVVVALAVLWGEKFVLERNCLELLRLQLVLAVQAVLGQRPRPIMGVTVTMEGGHNLLIYIGPEQ